MKRSSVPSGRHRYYIKWLRYYYDFCRKYNFKQEGTESLAAFMDKVKEKREAEHLREQARLAISLFYEMAQCSAGRVQNGILLAKKYRI